MNVIVKTLRGIGTFCLFVSINCYAQNDIGAENKGLSAIVSNSSSYDAPVYLNPACIADDSSLVVVSYYMKSYLVDELDKKSIGASVPILKKNRLSFAFSRQGTNLFLRDDASVSFARSFGSTVSFGLRCKSKSLHIPESAEKYFATTIESGLTFKLLKQLTVGATCNYPVATTKDFIVAYQNSKTIAFGFNNSFSKCLDAYFEVQQVQNQGCEFRTALLYRPNPKISLRGGINLNELQTSFGVSYLIDHFLIAINIDFIDRLGYSSNIGLVYLLRRKRE